MRRNRSMPAPGAGRREAIEHPSGPEEAAAPPTGVEGAASEREAERSREADRAARLRPSVALLLLIGAAVYLYWAAGDIPIVPVPGQLGPSFWPRLMLAGLMVTCLLKLVSLWWRPGLPAPGRAAAPAPAGEAPRVEASAPDVDGIRLALGVVLIGLYVAASSVVGFALANVLFVIGFMRLGGIRRPLPLVAMAVCTTVGLLYLFVKVVYLPLPRGEGVFLDATIALYRLLGLF